MHPRPSATGYFPPSDLCLSLFPDTRTRMVPSRMLHVRPTIPSTAAGVSAREGAVVVGVTRRAAGGYIGFYKAGPVGMGD